MSRKPSFEERFAAAWAPAAWRDVTVLVAVSGGNDSIALLRVLAAVRQSGAGRLVAAHVNHQLRGAESEADEAFVVELCGQLQVACDVGRVRVGTGDTASEAAARTARYGFLREAADRWGARYLATGHTADDQAETILQRIVRGTGISGLAGIPRSRPLSAATTLIRPLLGFRRQELAAYLSELGQACRHDSSNVDARYTRNRIRHRLLPELAEQFNSQVVEAVLRLGALAGEVQEVIAQDVAQLAERCTAFEPDGGVRVERRLLAGRPRYVVRELWMWIWRQQAWPLQAMSFAKWDQLAELAADSSAAAPAKHVFPGGVVVEICSDQVRLRRPPQDAERADRP